jgi:hypothetical protein
MHLGYTLSEADKLLDGIEGDSPEILISSALKNAGASS